MGLGGGRWQGQNKVLPGFYNRFVSGGKLSQALSDRGYGAIPIELDWGEDGKVFTVEQSDFYSNCTKFFGYGVDHEKMKPLRELFNHLKTGFFYKLTSKGEKATCTYAEARYCGVRGNDILLVIAVNINDNTRFDCSTYLGSTLADKQMAVTMDTLLDNDFVIWKRDVALNSTAGINLSGGTNGVVNGTAHQSALDKLEAYSFNILACLSSDEITKNLYVAYTKRMNDDVGSNFQMVGHKIASVNSEYCISVENNTKPDLVPWIVGIEASCAINKSRTNMKYDGEYIVDTNYSKRQLEDYIKAGKLMLHSVGQEVRVLEDINTFTEIETDKNQDFSLNQVIRILMQTSKDDAIIFNTYFLGKELNNENGRAALKSMLIDQRKKMEVIGAIENFDADTLIVRQGETKGSVVVDGEITPIGAMTILYSTTIVR